MEINLGLILASLINFFILFAILKHFFFGKVKAIIDEREEYINEQMDDAEEATNKARLLAIENERILKQAREEGKKITEEKKRKAEEIYDEVKRICPDIGLATVYRTVLLFEELNVIYKLDLNDGCSRYELVHEDEEHRHHHLICNKCKKVIEIWK